LLLALERRRITHPKGSGLRRFSKYDYIRDLRPAKWVSMINLHRKKSRTVLVRFGSWLFSNSGRALALLATDATVLGTSSTRDGDLG
jgi:hypothetical protein